MQNNFPIQTVTILGKSINTLFIYGTIPLFVDSFQVSWVLDFIDPAIPNQGLNEINSPTGLKGNMIINREELLVLNEDSIAQLLCSKLSITMA